MRYALVLAQLLSFLALGVLFLASGETRLGLAQMLLGAVTVLIYL